MATGKWLTLQLNAHEGIWIVYVFGDSTGLYPGDGVRSSGCVQKVWLAERVYETNVCLPPVGHAEALAAPPEAGALLRLVVAPCFPVVVVSSGTAGGVVP